MAFYSVTVEGSSFYVGPLGYYVTMLESLLNTAVLQARQNDTPDAVLQDQLESMVENVFSKFVPFIRIIRMFKDASFERSYSSIGWSDNPGLIPTDPEFDPDSFVNTSGILDIMNEIAEARNDVLNNVASALESKELTLDARDQAQAILASINIQQEVLNTAVSNASDYAQSASDSAFIAQSAIQDLRARGLAVLRADGTLTAVKLTNEFDIPVTLTDGSIIYLKMV